MVDVPAISSTGSYNYPCMQAGSPTVPITSTSLPMNDSVFNYASPTMMCDSLDMMTGSCGMPYMGGMPYMSGMPYMMGGFMGGIPFMGNQYYHNGTFDYEKFQQDRLKYMDMNADFQKEYIEHQRANEISLNSPYEGLQNAAVMLHEKIVTNEQDQIVMAWQKYLAAVQRIAPSANEQDMINRAKTMYGQIVGTSLVDDIRQYGSNSFTAGFTKTLTFGNIDKRSAEENISILTNLPQGKKQKALHTAGCASAGALIATGGALLLKCLPFVRKIPKVGKLLGALIVAGGVAGAVFGSKS